MPVRGDYLVVPDGQPLVSVPADEDGRRLTYYFADQETADAVLPHAVADALAVAGAWSELDWDEMFEELERIRKEGKPTSSMPGRPTMAATAAALDLRGTGRRHRNQAAIALLDE